MRFSFALHCFAIFCLALLCYALLWQIITNIKDTISAEMQNTLPVQTGPTTVDYLKVRSSNFLALIKISTFIFASSRLNSQCFRRDLTVSATI